MPFKRHRCSPTKLYLYLPMCPILVWAHVWLVFNSRSLKALFQPQHQHQTLLVSLSLSSWLWIFVFIYLFPSISPSYLSLPLIPLPLPLSHGSSSSSLHYSDALVSLSPLAFSLLYFLLISYLNNLFRYISKCSTGACERNRSVYWTGVVVCGCWDVCGDDSWSFLFSQTWTSLDEKNEIKKWKNAFWSQQVKAQVT